MHIILNAIKNISTKYDPKTVNYINLYYKSDFDSVLEKYSEISDISDDLIQPIGLLAITEILQDISNENNVDNKDLVSFRTRASLALNEFISKQTDAKATKSASDTNHTNIDVLLQNIVQNQDEKIIASSFIKLFAICVDFYQQEKLEDFSGTVFKISVLIDTMIQKNNINFLKRFFDLDNTEIAKLNCMSRNKRLDLICLDLLPDFAKDLNLDFNHWKKPKNAITFDPKVIQKISDLLEKNNSSLTFLRKTDEIEKDFF